MIDNSSYYNLFFRFIEAYGPKGFDGIDPGDPLIIDLEKMMERGVL